jgi:hypothetical protein
VTAERARDSVEHLRAAARELIAAARAALDVAEDIVEDPSAVRELTEPRSPGAPSWVQQMVSAAGSLGALGDLVRSATARSDAAEAPAAGDPGDDPGHEPGDDTTVERIVIR